MRPKTEEIIMTYPQKSERYIKYAEILLSNGFSEAKKSKGHFFRQATEQKAFIVNLGDDEEGSITLLYGFTSTACMIGDEEWFENHGSDIVYCQVRNILFIWDEESEFNAQTKISDFYAKYKTHSKEEIISVKKERDKEFLSHFKRAFKPLGFKKKGKKWTRILDNGSALTLDAQKSAFSDQYYFNITIHEASDFYAIQFYERVVMNGSNLYNWQLMTDEQIDNLIKHILKNYIEPNMR